METLSDSKVPFAEAMQSYLLDTLFLLTSHDPISNTLKAMGLKAMGAKVGANSKIWRLVWIDRPRKLELGNDVTIGRGAMLICQGGIRIGDRVMIGHGAQIVSSGHTIPSLSNAESMRFAPLTSNEVVIASDVWIGAGAIILQGVRIGAHTVVGAGSIVTKDLPERVIAAGNPARIVRQRL